MAVLDLVTLPVRLGVAAAQTTLALGQLVAPEGPVRRSGGYAERVMVVIGEGGLVERLSAALADAHGPMHLVNTLAAVLDSDRPLGRALAPGGTVDRLLALDGPLYRLLDEDGAVDRLLQQDGVLERLVAPDGPLERLLAAGGALDRVTRPGGLLESLLAEDGFVDKLVADGGTLDQLVELGATLERIQPRLAELIGLIPDLHESVDALNRAVEPLSGLATRIPGGRRRTTLEA